MRAARGITSRETGLAAGRRALIELRAAAAKELHERHGDMTMSRMVLLGLLARAEAFHRSVLEAITANNPFATFTLLRSYSENAALMVWLQQSPGRMARLDLADPDARGPKIGVIVQAAHERLQGFGAIYEQLSTFAHPASAGLLVSWRDGGDDVPEGAFEWNSAPSFKSDTDAEMACFWLVELSEFETPAVRAHTPRYADQCSNATEQTPRRSARQRTCCRGPVRVW